MESFILDCEPKHGRVLGTLRKWSRWLNATCKAKELDLLSLRSYYMDVKNNRKVTFYAKTVQNLLDVFVTNNT